MQYWGFNWHGEWVGKGARWGQAVSTEGRKEDGGKRTISCYAARLCHVLGLGYCRPFINVKYAGKGEKGPSVEEGSSEDNLLQHYKAISY